MSITIHPEIAILRDRLRELRLELRMAIDDWCRLSTEVRPRLHATYNALFGELERELQQGALAAAEMFRRVELLSIKHERGERLTPEIVDLINQVVDKEYARFTMRIREAFSMDARQREELARAQQGHTSDHELVTMYRTLVKQLHPDVAAGAQGASTDTSVWHQVQSAYASRNAGQLRSLLTVLGAEDVHAAESDAWDVGRWQQEVVAVEQRLALEQRKLSRLRLEEPFSLEQDLGNESWQIRHREALLQAIARKKKELRDSQRRYNELTEGLIPSGTNPSKSKDEQSFEEEFMTNTYFGQR